MSRLEIVDPVFAAYLMYRGCTVEEVEPASSSNNPKKYIFDEKVKDTPFEAEFLGINVAPLRTTWRNFIEQLNSLFTMEDLILRQYTNRPRRIGIDTRIEKTPVFVTTDQGGAAFLLTQNGGILPVDVRGMGSDQGFLFVFSEHKRALHLYTEMLNGKKSDSWWNMKCAHKRATSIRRALNLHNQREA